MKTPKEILEIFIHLKYNNSIAYLVGGCVRDMHLGKQPKDFDIVTDCNLDDLNIILTDNGWKVKEAGKQFLVMIVSKNGMDFEIANLRKDGTYTDGRKPDFVEIGDIDTDSARRDITINSLYYDPFTGITLDPTKQGLKDIRDRVIRMNGRAKQRIIEDKLRIMRVYRFAARLGFEIDKNTLKACRQYFGDMIEQVSSERIKNEIEKMVGL